MTKEQVQIQLEHGTLNLIKYFIQLERDEISINRNPGNQDLPEASNMALSRNYNTHTKFIKNYAPLEDADKLKDFSI